jgi:hypothetical protein
MRVKLLALALSVSALLTSASAQAHTQPVTPKGLHADAIASLVTPEATKTIAMLADPRPSFSSRSSYGGFRSSSSSSYRSFSPSPSHTYTYRSSPSTYSAPASKPTTTYHYSAPAAARSAPKSRPTVVNHYHSSESSSGSHGGMSMTDYLILNQVMSNNREPEPRQVSAANGHNSNYENSSYPQALQSQEQPEESHFWQYTCLIAVAGALSYGAYRYWQAHRIA